ncbi:MAG: winged helix-turn-helix domain-containing protein [Candidatus Levyibacteriota bacterium]
MPAPRETSDELARPRAQIGDWFADPGSNELIRGSERVRIEPKAMDVLMLLVARGGRVVTREELFATVWPGVVVGDEALTQTINKLRKALGDRSRSPSYIETIAKRGYRLIAPVRRGEAVDAVPAGADPAVSDQPPAGHGPPGQRTSGQRRYARSVGGMIAVLVMAVAAAVYFFHPIPGAPPAPDTRAQGGTHPQGWVTVSVAPFVSLSADRKQDYLARGISDDLIAALSRVSDLRVIRESSASAGGPAAQAARYRILGSVQRESGTLRIIVHLVDSNTHAELWSERFERPFGDLFAIQDEMAVKLAELLPAKISDVERRRLAKRYTTSLEAYDDFLRGEASFLVRQREANEAARALYRKALDLDPKFARAYAGLAMTYAMAPRLNESADPSPDLDRALKLAETAQQIDPDLPEVYWALGFVHAQSRRHDEAIASLQKLIELDPSFADAYALLGGIYTYIGQPARSIPLLRTAMRLNPDGGYLYFLLLGRAYLFEDDTEQALVNLRAAAIRNPVDVETHVYLAAASVAAGERSAAAWEAEEIRRLQPGFSTRQWLETYPMTSARQTRRLQTLLADLAL